MDTICFRDEAVWNLRLRLKAQSLHLYIMPTLLRTLFTSTSRTYSPTSYTVPTAFATFRYARMVHTVPKVCQLVLGHSAGPANIPYCSCKTLPSSSKNATSTANSPPPPPARRLRSTIPPQASSLAHVLNSMPQTLREPSPRRQKHSTHSGRRLRANGRPCSGIGLV